MLGYHLLWKDRLRDELISFTNSFRFLITHGARRGIKGGKKIFYHVINRRQAETVTQSPAHFYEANDLCRHFEVGSTHWPHPSMHGNLHPRKFNHEYLASTTVVMRQGGAYMASHETLAAHGVFDLYPHVAHSDDGVQCPGYEPIVSGLYELLCAARYGPPYANTHPVQAEEVNMVLDCARQFLLDVPAIDRAGAKPPLWLVIELCCGKKRTRGHNGPLIQMLTDMGYTGTLEQPRIMYQN